MPISIKKDSAIGVFDSGLGGLTVVKELIKLLPGEDIVYFGDTARVPYGTKSKESIIRFSIENVGVLLKYKIKMVVVACNSSSSCAIGELKKRFALPVIDVIGPGALSAIGATKNNRVGVIATTATVKSGKYEAAIKKHRNKASVFSQNCPLLVPLVEEGWLNRKTTYDVARQYVSPLKSKRVDTLILGCTHYPLLKNVLKSIMGRKVALIDSGQSVARVVKAKLGQMGCVNKRRGVGKRIFIVSDKPQEFKRIAKNFLGFDIKKIKQVKD